MRTQPRAIYKTQHAGIMIGYPGRNNTPRISNHYPIIQEKSDYNDESVFDCFALY